jgi:hypothetical protein
MVSRLITKHSLCASNCYSPHSTCKMTQPPIEGANSRRDLSSTILDLGPVAAPDHAYRCGSIAVIEDVYHQISIDLADQDYTPDAGPTFRSHGQDFMMDYGSGQSHCLMSHGTPDSRTANDGQTRKRSTGKSACLQCRKRKKRCSSQRPVCEYRNLRGLDCSWDAHNGSVKIECYERKTPATGIYVNNGPTSSRTTKIASDRTYTSL